MNAKEAITQPTVLNNRRGNTTVELAMLMLPFLIMTLGVVEMGWYFFHQHTLQYATREGMRLALVGGTLLDPEGEPLTREESIDKVIRDKAQVALNSNELRIYPHETVGNNFESPVGWETLAPNAGNPAEFMRIKVEYDHYFLVPLIGTFFPDNDFITLKAEANYRNELFETEV